MDINQGHTTGPVEQGAIDLSINHLLNRAHHGGRMASFLKMGNYRIGARLNIGFLQVILLTLLVGVVALYQMSALGHLVNELYDHPLTVGYTARDIRGISMRYTP